MFPNNMQFLGRERDKERYQEADHLRLIKIAKGEQPSSKARVQTVINWMGSQMVKWGGKLQSYGQTSVFSTGQVETGYPQN